MPTLAAWLHDLDPCALRVGGLCVFRWYGLSYVAGFAVAWAILHRMVKAGRTRLSDPGAIGDLMVAVVLGVLVGGRLGYVLLYRPPLLWDLDGSFPWWGVLKINEGGMASHGGMVGAALACLWFARRQRVPFLHVTDLGALVTPFGLLFGRLANFVNGELLGRVVAPPGEPAPRWAVRFPQELLTDHAPELTAEQRLALDSLLYDTAPTAATRGQQIDAVIGAVQNGVADVAGRLEPLLAARHPSQLYQALAEGVVLPVALWLIWARTRSVGVVSAWFLIVYGGLRIATEHWRLPDDHLAVARPLGLTRGQWYSAAMIVAGGVVLWVALRRRQDRAKKAAPEGDSGADGGSVD